MPTETPSREGIVGRVALGVGRSSGSRPGGRAKYEQDPALQRFFQLFDVVSRWCGDHAERIADTYLAPGMDDIGLYVVGKSEAFDFELNSELSDLVIELVKLGFPVYATLLPGCTPVETDDLEPRTSQFGVYRLTLTRM